MFLQYACDGGDVSAKQYGELNERYGAALPHLASGLKIYSGSIRWSKEFAGGAGLQPGPWNVVVIAIEDDRGNLSASFSGDEKGDAGGRSGGEVRSGTVSFGAEKTYGGFEIGRDANRGGTWFKGQYWGLKPQHDESHTLKSLTKMAIPVGWSGEKQPAK
jgi:hypothetical protein